MQISYLLPLILFVPFLSALLLGVAALMSHNKEEGLSESVIGFLAVGAPAISASIDADFVFAAAHPAGATLAIYPGHLDPHPRF